MSVDTNQNEPVALDDDQAERDRAIQAAYDDLGRPPTARHASEYTVHSHDWHKFSGDVWDDILRDAGVPGYDDLVAEWLTEKFANRYPWQEFITVQAGQMADSVDLNQSHIGLKLKQIAEGDRCPVAAAGLSIERCPTGNGHTKWTVSSDE